MENAMPSNPIHALQRTAADRRGFAAGDGPNSVAVGDFNGDGKQDLAVANSSDNVNVLLGDGLGGFSGAGFRQITPATTDAKTIPLLALFCGDLDW
jgi:hypothetical protein